MAIEMLTGKHPLKGFDYVKILRFHLKKNILKYILPDNVMPDCKVMKYN